VQGDRALEDLLEVLPLLLCVEMDHDGFKFWRQAGKADFRLAVRPRFLDDPHFENVSSVLLSQIDDSLTQIWLLVADDESRRQ